MPDPVLRYDPATGRYRSAAGRFVSEDLARAAVDDLTTKAAQRMDSLTARLMGGQMRLADWQDAMRAEIQAVHGTLATVAQGGRAQMSPAAWGRLSGRLRFQYDRLAVFALDLAQGRVTEAQAVSRARSYGRSAYLTYEETRRQMAQRRGVTEEKWTRRASESCSGCQEQAARSPATGGWVPAGTLPPLGSQPCRGNCRCVIQTRRAPTEAAA